MGAVRAIVTGRDQSAAADAWADDLYQATAGDTDLAVEPRDWHDTDPLLRMLTPGEVPDDTADTLETIGIDVAMPTNALEPSGTVTIRSELGIAVAFGATMPDHVTAAYRSPGEELTVTYTDAVGEVILGSIPAVSPGTVAQFEFRSDGTTLTLHNNGWRPATEAEIRLARALGYR